MDGKLGDSQAPGSGGGDTPTVRQQSASSGAAQLEELENSTLTQSKPVNLNNKPRVLLSLSRVTPEGTRCGKLLYCPHRQTLGY